MRKPFKGAKKKVAAFRKTMIDIFSEISYYRSAPAESQSM